VFNLYESIKQGLNEAIEYERGNLPNVKVDKIVDKIVTWQNSNNP